MPFCGHPQQYLEQFDNRRAIRRWPETVQARQCLVVAFDPALDRVDDLLAPSRALKSLWQ